MKKTLLTLILAVSLASVPVYADDKDEKIAELEKQIAEMQTTIDDLTAQLEELTVGTSQDSYAIGETWTVPGQWRLTVDSIEETDQRNAYTNKEPAAVYIISYTYENIGYESKLMDGLFIYLNDGIVDSAGSMGYSYPGHLGYQPQITPVGATCKAQSCIGVDNAGSFEIHFQAFDSSNNIQRATFNIEVN